MADSLSSWLFVRAAGGQKVAVWLTAAQDEDSHTTVNTADTH